MAERSRKALFWRFLALSILGVATDVLLYLLLHTALGPLVTRALSLLAALVTIRALLSRIDLTGSAASRVGAAGITAVLTIAAMLNYGLFAALIVSSPSLQPMAAMAFAAVMSFAFGCFGYLRLLNRRD